MRLIDTHTGQFIEKDPEDSKTLYAILSHTWDQEGEQPYEELRSIQRRYPPNPHQAAHPARDGPEGRTSSSPDHHPPGPSSTPHLQLPHDPDRPDVTASPVTTYNPSNSWFSLKISRFKKRFKRSSTPSHAPPLFSDTPSPAQRPAIGLGSLAQSGVEASHAFVGEYGLVTPAAVPVQNAPSALLVAPSPEPTPSPQAIWDDPQLSPKIREACRVARENGYRYIWIDSCCIDKTSSSELSEAINSMYKWYGMAVVCYAFLADVPSGESHWSKDSNFRKSRWFGRGWTLQELIAPFRVEFLSSDWAPIGCKASFADLVENITNISSYALLHLKPLEAFSVAQRLSWAAKRDTTRKEDRAYSLLGLFDINMPTLYGEGDRAFRRLQEEIMQRTPDQSLFAWGNLYLSSELSQNSNPTDPKLVAPDRLRVNAVAFSADWIFATSPGNFRNGDGISTLHLSSSPRHEIEYTSTPYGIRTQFWMIPLTQSLLLHAIPRVATTQLEFDGPIEDTKWYLAVLDCEVHTQNSEHLLGRVCYIRPSKTDVNFIHSGSIYVVNPQRGRLTSSYSNLIPLLPVTLENFRMDAEMKTVYIPHPERTALDIPSSLLNQPHSMIKLVLLRETRNALRSQGYSVELRDPGTDNPTTHWLTISKGKYTIGVKFNHTLNDNGMRFTICGNIEVELSGSYEVQLDSAPPKSDHCQWEAVRETMYWSNMGYPWSRKLDRRSIRLSRAGTTMFTVDFELDFVGTGFYLLRIDAPSNAESSEEQRESHLFPWDTINIDLADLEEAVRSRAETRMITFLPMFSPIEPFPFRLRRRSSCETGADSEA
uniref:Alcohol oxidase n=1 Tax=Ganoderma boninense TaxID=34458 RepID=A0A5K1K6J1_9APHY|nr:Alcohol oxidase [Ganoderma boninense]